MPDIAKLLKSRNRFSPFLRTTSALLICAFLAQDVVYANPNLADSVQKLAYSVERIADRKDSQNLPEEIGTVEESFVTPYPLSAKRYTLFLIQDAHVNESAQRNIAKIIDHLIDTEKIQTVFLEAGTGDDSLSDLRPLADAKKRRDVSERFLRKGYIQGPDYLDLNSDKTFRLWGVEDKSLYHEGLILYRDIQKNRDAANAFVDRIARALKTLKVRQLNPKLLDFDKKREAYLQNTYTLTDYFKTLSEQATQNHVSLLAYPNFLMLKDVQAKEAAIDFQKANEEQQAAMASLPAHDQKELREILKSSAKGLERVGAGNAKKLGDFYARLKQILVTRSPGHQVTGQAELEKYFAYLKAVQKIQHESLLKELEEIEEQVYAALTTTDEERSLVEITRIQEILDRLVNLKATSSDIRQIQQNPEKFTTIQVGGALNRQFMLMQSHYEDVILLDDKYDKVFEQAKQFYELTQKRDEAFVQNIIKYMDGDPKSNKAAFVVGGFHVEHLKQRLREKNISYVSIMPRVTSETNMKKYEKLLLDGIQSIDYRQQTIDQKIQFPKTIVRAESLKKMWGVRPARQAMVVENGARLAVWEELRKELGSPGHHDTTSPVRQVTESQGHNGARLADVESAEWLERESGLADRMANSIPYQKVFATIKAHLNTQSDSRSKAKKNVVYIEGVQTAGKSTFSLALKQYLEKSGNTVHIVRDTEFARYPYLKVDFWEGVWVAARIIFIQIKGFLSPDNFQSLAQYVSLMYDRQEAASFRKDLLSIQEGDRGWHPNGGIISFKPRRSGPFQRSDPVKKISVDRTDVVILEATLASELFGSTSAETRVLLDRPFSKDEFASRSQKKDGLHWLKSWVAAYLIPSALIEKDYREFLQLYDVVVDVRDRQNPKIIQVSDPGARLAVGEDYEKTAIYDRARAHVLLNGRNFSKDEIGPILNFLMARLNKIPITNGQRSDIFDLITGRLYPSAEWQFSASLQNWLGTTIESLGIKWLPERIYLGDVTRKQFNERIGNIVGLAMRFIFTPSSSSEISIMDRAQGARLSESPAGEPKSSSLIKGLAPIYEDTIEFVNDYPNWKNEHPDSTVLLIARHAESYLNAMQRVQGYSSFSPLNSAGRQQASWLARLLEKFKEQGFHLDFVYSTPHERTYHTALLSARVFDTTPTVKSGLREVQFYPEETSGQKVILADRTYPDAFSQFARDPFDFSIPNGYSGVTTKLALEKIMREIEAATGKNHMIVMHGRTLQWMLMTLLNINLDQYEPLAFYLKQFTHMERDPENASVTAFAYNHRTRKWSLLVWADARYPIQMGENWGIVERTPLGLQKIEYLYTALARSVQKQFGHPSPMPVSDYWPDMRTILSVLLTKEGARLSNSKLLPFLGIFFIVGYGLLCLDLIWPEAFRLQKINIGYEQPTDEQDISWMTASDWDAEGALWRVHQLLNKSNSRESEYKVKGNRAYLKSHLLRAFETEIDQIARLASTDGQLNSQKFFEEVDQYFSKVLDLAVGLDIEPDLLKEIALFAGKWNALAAQKSEEPVDIEAAKKTSKNLADKIPAERVPRTNNKPSPGTDNPKTSFASRDLGASLLGSRLAGIGIEEPSLKKIWSLFFVSFGLLLSGTVLISIQMAYWLYSHPDEFTLVDYLSGSTGLSLLAGGLASLVYFIILQYQRHTQRKMLRYPSIAIYLDDTHVHAGYVEKATDIPVVPAIEILAPSKDSGVRALLQAITDAVDKTIKSANFNPSDIRDLIVASPGDLKDANLVGLLKTELQQKGYASIRVGVMSNFKSEDGLKNLLSYLFGARLADLSGDKSRTTEVRGRRLDRTGARLSNVTRLHFDKTRLPSVFSVDSKGYQIALNGEGDSILIFSPEMSEPYLLVEGRLYSPGLNSRVSIALNKQSAGAVTISVRAPNNAIVTVEHERNSQVVDQEVATSTGSSKPVGEAPQKIQKKQPKDAQYKKTTLLSPDEIRIRHVEEFISKAPVPEKTRTFVRGLVRRVAWKIEARDVKNILLILGNPTLSDDAIRLIEKYIHVQGISGMLVRVSSEGPSNIVGALFELQAAQWLEKNHYGKVVAFGYEIKGDGRSSEIDIILDKNGAKVFVEAKSSTKEILNFDEPRRQLRKALNDLYTHGEKEGLLADLSDANVEAVIVLSEPPRWIPDKDRSSLPPPQELSLARDKSISLRYVKVPRSKLFRPRAAGFEIQMTKRPMKRDRSTHLTVAQERGWSSYKAKIRGTYANIMGARLVDRIQGARLSNVLPTSDWRAYALREALEQDGVPAEKITFSMIRTLLDALVLWDSTPNLSAVSGAINTVFKSNQIVPARTLTGRDRARKYREMVLPEGNFKRMLIVPLGDSDIYARLKLIIDRANLRIGDLPDDFPTYGDLEGPVIQHQNFVATGVKYWNIRFKQISLDNPPEYFSYIYTTFFMAHIVTKLLSFNTIPTMEGSKYSPLDVDKLMKGLGYFTALSALHAIRYASELGLDESIVTRLHHRVVESFAKAFLVKKGIIRRSLIVDETVRQALKIDSVLDAEFLRYMKLVEPALRVDMFGNIIVSENPELISKVVQDILAQPGPLLAEPELPEKIPAAPAVAVKISLGTVNGKEYTPPSQPLASSTTSTSSISTVPLTDEKTQGPAAPLVSQETKAALPRRTMQGSHRRVIAEYIRTDHSGVEITDGLINSVFDLLYPENSPQLSNTLRKSKIAELLGTSKSRGPLILNDLRNLITLKVRAINLINERLKTSPIKARYLGQMDDWNVHIDLADKQNLNIKYETQDNYDPWINGVILSTPDLDDDALFGYVIRSLTFVEIVNGIVTAPNTAYAQELLDVLMYEHRLDVLTDALMLRRARLLRWTPDELSRLRDKVTEGMIDFASARQGQEVFAENIEREFQEYAVLFENASLDPDRWLRDIRNSSALSDYSILKDIVATHSVFDAEYRETERSVYKMVIENEQMIRLTGAYRLGWIDTIPTDTDIKKIRKLQKTLRSLYQEIEDPLDFDQVSQKMQENPELKMDPSEMVKYMTLLEALSYAEFNTSVKDKTRFTLHYKAKKGGRRENAVQIDFSTKGVSSRQSFYLDDQPDFLLKKITFIPSDKDPDEDIIMLDGEEGEQFLVRPSGEFYEVDSKRIELLADGPQVIHAKNIESVPQDLRELMVQVGGARLSNLSGGSVQESGDRRQRTGDRITDTDTSANLGLKSLSQSFRRLLAGLIIGVAMAHPAAEAKIPLDGDVIPFRREGSTVEAVYRGDVIKENISSRTMALRRQQAKTEALLDANISDSADEEELIRTLERIPSNRLNKTPDLVYLDTAYFASDPKGLATKFADALAKSYADGQVDDLYFTFVVGEDNRAAATELQSYFEGSKASRYFVDIPQLPARLKKDDVDVINTFVSSNDSLIMENKRNIPLAPLSPTSEINPSFFSLLKAAGGVSFNVTPIPFLVGWGRMSGVIPSQEIMRQLFTGNPFSGSQQYHIYPHPVKPVDLTKHFKGARMSERAA